MKRPLKSAKCKEKWKSYLSYMHVCKINKETDVYIGVTRNSTDNTRT